MGRFVGRIMAHGINRLSARRVEAVKEAGQIGDGGGLYLQISKSGSKSWLFRFMINGRSREMGLGSRLGRFWKGVLRLSPIHIIKVGQNDGQRST